MVKNPAPAPAQAGFAIKIRQNLALAGFEKANPVQPYYVCMKGLG